MTFAADLERRAKTAGRERFWCGQLPTGTAVHMTFDEYKHFGDKKHFPGPIHRFAAGLVVAHSRDAGTHTDPDDIIAAWTRPRGDRRVRGGDRSRCGGSDSYAA